MNDFHTPVLKDEVINALDIAPGKKYIDATIGGGGHTREILNRGGFVLGLDRDPDAIRYVEKEFEEDVVKGKLTLVQTNFAEIREKAEQFGFVNVAGILFDLGVSSYQIDKSGRGFSFRFDEPLDMRMNNQAGVTAEKVVNEYSESELYEIFAKYGEEPNAKEVAHAICLMRVKAPIVTSGQLAQVVSSVSPKNGKIHPATRVFQAIRIVVNSELDSLKKGLSDSVEVLGAGGRLVVISFHSLEDRVTKLNFLEFERSGIGRVYVKKPKTAEYHETQINRRARSAKLRVFEKR
ncbi:MAG TPA: 16S rRNA (cytosine(1402)-N(4))-methyltransferase RsmH [Patescibacteria group bacterium]|nr:16S rRNA (cytosine(1402)-N(4))-methyltransferase RsmH [Patescibacteria group bacterium]